MMYVENCEADDIIATLVKEQKEDLYLIVSGDKEIKIQKLDTVIQEDTPSSMMWNIVIGMGVLALLAVLGGFIYEMVNERQIV
mgnify:CR=1 FL=1